VRHHSTIIAILALFGIALTIGVAAIPARTQSDQGDFLSPEEGDQIREAPSPGERARLFVVFAGDRLKKIQYELQRKEPEVDRSEILNGLLSSFADCMDEADDRIETGRKKGENMRDAVKELEKQGKDYLEALQKVEAGGDPQLASLRDNLDDAIESTKDALHDAEKAAKEYGPVPVRRKPGA
jgi:hypothetical protein